MLSALQRKPQHAHGCGSVKATWAEDTRRNDTNHCKLSLVWCGSPEVPLSHNQLRLCFERRTSQAELLYRIRRKTQPAAMPSLGLKKKDNLTKMDSFTDMPQVCNPVFIYHLSANLLMSCNIFTGQMLSEKITSLLSVMSDLQVLVGSTAYFSNLTWLP